jgi:hypothetical protein
LVVAPGKTTTHQERRLKSERTDAEAAAAIEAERAARAAKTEKLRQARLAAEKDKKKTK